jgi:spermidine/putrescine transport system ATP-binding protein
MNQGHLEQFGSPAEVYQRPASEFVADFIGSTNLLPGAVRDYDPSSQQAEVDLEAGATRLRVRHDRPLAAGARVKVLCKPEHLRVSPDLSGCPLQGEVTGTAYLGAVTQFEVEVGSARLEVVVPADQAPAVGLGARVGVELRPETLRLIAL